MIKAIIKHPSQPPFVMMIPNDLEFYQSVVGGYIEAVSINGYVAICNEEGRIYGLPYNCRIGDVDFVGPVVFVAQDGEEFAGLTSYQIHRIINVDIEEGKN